uniref:Uncharacterized protein n=1 Tax=Arundo donax TaxID=35708 RepID=A0A0A9BY16_ARUDO
MESQCQTKQIQNELCAGLWLTRDEYVPRDVTVTSTQLVVKG